MIGSGPIQNLSENRLGEGDSPILLRRLRKIGTVPGGFRIGFVERAGNVSCGYPVEAVIRSSAQRLRPVFLTTVTAIGGLFPMMLAVEIDFWTRHVTVGGPNGMMWVQMSTAIVFSESSLFGKSGGMTCPR